MNGSFVIREQRTELVEGQFELHFVFSHFQSYEQWENGGIFHMVITWGLYIILK